MRNATAGVTMIPGITFAGTFEPDGTGTYQIIGGVTKSDGLHIVRAVNAHDALVEALERSNKHLKQARFLLTEETAAHAVLTEVIEQNATTLKLVKGE